MKISKITVGATIATAQYQNIQPSIEISDIEDIQVASELGTEWIKEHFERFSTTGKLTEKEIEITPQKKTLLTKVQ